MYYAKHVTTFANVYRRLSSVKDCEYIIIGAKLRTIRQIAARTPLQLFCFSVSAWRRSQSGQRLATAASPRFASMLNTSNPFAPCLRAINPVFNLRWKSQSKLGQRDALGSDPSERIYAQENIKSCKPVGCCSQMV